MLYNELPASKTILAKLMARENVSVIQRNITTAAFDPVSRTVYIPYWKEMTADMYDVQISHETGHAIDTPVDKENFKGILAKYINIIEDGRIEKRQIRRLPGLQKSYRIGRAEMFNRGFYNTTQEQVASRTFIDRINLYFKCHLWGILNVQFAEGFESDMMKKIILADTYAEVVQYAKEVLAYDKRNAQKKNKALSQPKTDKPSKQTESEKEKESPNESSEEEAELEVGPESDDEDEEMTDEEFEKQEEVAPSEKAFEENMNKLVDNKADQPCIMLSMPKMNASEYIISASVVLKSIEKSVKMMLDTKYITNLNNELNANYIRFRNENSAAINSLAKEFEIRKAGDRHHRMRNTRLGDLDMTKIHEYKFNDKLFLGGSVTDDGKNHGVVMLVDMSGSMTSCMYGVVKQYLIMAEFCKRVNIPFDIYGFSNHDSVLTETRVPALQTRINDIVLFNNLRLVNLLSSSQPAAEYKKLFAYLAAYGEEFRYRRNAKTYGGESYRLNNVDAHDFALLELSGTPLSAALYLMPNLIKNFKSKNNLQIVNLIVMTDGDGDRIEKYKTEVAGKDSLIYNSKREKVTFVDREFLNTYEYVFSPEQRNVFHNNWVDAAYYLTMNLLTKRIESLNCRVVNINLCNTYGLGAGHTEVMQKSKKANQFFASQKLSYAKKIDKNDEEFAPLIKNLKEVGFVHLESKLYTHEFILATNTLTSVQIEIDENSSAKKIANSIMENSKNKNKDRMLAIAVSKLISN